MTTRTLLHFAAMAAIVAPVNAAVEWHTKLDKACTLAAQQNKAVLILFTGSDWCGWCVQLKKELLTSAAFEEYISGRFVAVEIDVPNNPARVGGAQQLEKNRGLCRYFGISTFPSVLVLTAEGAAVGGFSGSADMEEAREALDAALANSAELKKVEALQGLEKARALYSIYQSIPEDLRPSAHAMKEQILALDTEDAMGLRRQHEAQKQLSQIEQQLAGVRENDFDAAVAIIDKALPTAMPENRESLEQAKINFIQLKIYKKLAQVKSVADVEKVKQMLLTEFIPAIPEEDRAEVREQIEKEFSDPERVLREQLEFCSED